MINLFFIFQLEKWFISKIIKKKSYKISIFIIFSLIMLYQNKIEREEQNLFEFFEIDRNYPNFNEELKKQIKKKQSNCINKKTKICEKILEKIEIGNKILSKERTRIAYDKFKIKDEFFTSKIKYAKIGEIFLVYARYSSFFYFISNYNYSTHIRKTFAYLVILFFLFESLVMLNDKIVNKDFFSIFFGRRMTIFERFNYVRNILQIVICFLNYYGIPNFITKLKNNFESAINTVNKNLSIKNSRKLLKNLEDSVNILNKLEDKKQLIEEKNDRYKRFIKYIFIIAFSDWFFLSMIESLKVMNL